MIDYQDYKSEKDNRAIVLCSGGMDSITTLALAVKEVHEIYVLFINYGQKSSDTERKYSLAAAMRFNSSWKEFEVNLGPLVDSSLIKGRPDDNTNTEVQGRNAIFISLATAYAQTINAGKVFIGIQKEDVPYKDAGQHFFHMIDLAMFNGYNVRVRAPLLFKAKVQIIELAKDLNVDLSKSHSCYYNENNPCGKCISCNVRKIGFEEFNNIR